MNIGEIIKVINLSEFERISNNEWYYSNNSVSDDEGKLKIDDGLFFHYYINGKKIRVIKINTENATMFKNTLVNFVIFIDNNVHTDNMVEILHG